MISQINLTVLFNEPFWIGVFELIEDEEHIEWLKRYLQSYENAFILISHDIPFINSVVNLSC